jgi:hypothetical protein
MMLMGKVDAIDKGKGSWILTLKKCKKKLKKINRC